ncbi:MAG TPA: tetratricopeptide repeat protein [Opitutus sp.]|nr:tetratricopeptide repeat protein [Opitutus sp.]
MGLIVVAGWLAYGNTFDAPFVFDDRAAILENPTIRELWPLTTPLSPPIDGRAVAGRPLVNLTLALNYAWSGTDVWSYHLVNLALHLAAAVVLFGLVRRTVRRRWSGSGDARSSVLFATVLALLWTLHPLQTESVTCVVQRTELLGGLFSLLVLYGFARAMEATQSANRWLVFSTVACLLGMAAKESVVTIPVVVLLYDRTFAAGSFGAAWRQRWKYYVALASTWILLAALLIRGGGSRGSAAGFESGVSSWNYLLQQSEAVLLYLKLMFWPHPLVVDYGTGYPASLSEVWLQGAIVVALLVATGWALVRRPVIGFLAASIFIVLSPSSSFVPLAAQTMAEHRMYLPLAAGLALVLLGIQAVAGRRGLLAVAGISLVAGIMTRQRNELYRNEVELWAETAARVPANLRAHVNLGGALLDAERIDEAVVAYEQAAQLQPNSAEVHANLCQAYTRLGRFAEALAHGETAVRLAPEDPDSRVNLAAVFVRLGRLDDAIAHYATARRIQPDATDLANAFADTLVQQAQVLARQGRLPEAQQRVTEALELAPNLAGAHFASGNLAAAAQNFEGALNAFQRAVDLDPLYIAARNNLGNCQLVTGRFQDAIATYEQVLQANPDDQAARQNLELARAELRKRSP